MALLIGIFGNGTCIDNENVGGIDKIYFEITLFLKFSGDGRRLRIIEFTPQRIKCDFLHPSAKLNLKSVNLIMGHTVDYKKLITLEAGKRGGKPCIRNMRITVYDILNWFASGMTRENILNDFPELTNDDITAALMFAADREAKATVIVQ